MRGVSFHRWWKRRHSPSIATRKYPASPHCKRDAVARPWRWPCHPIAAGSRSRRADRPIDRSCVGAGWSAAQSACGATTFLWSEKGSPGFPPEPRPKGPTSVSTINDSTMRLCRADLPAATHPIAAGSRSHSVSPYRAYSSERRTAISAVAADGWYRMRARRDSAPGAPCLLVPKPSGDRQPCLQGQPNDEKGLSTGCQY